MTKSLSEDRDSFIERIINETKKHSVGTVDQPLLDFLSHYFDTLPSDDLRSLDTLDLRGAALCHWQLGKQHRSGRASVHVYNPEFEKHGWQSTHTIVEIVTEDKPFLVDSLTIAINRAGLTTHLTIHPVYTLTRDAKKGHITGIGDNPKAHAESFMHFQIDRQTDPEVLTQLEKTLCSVIEDVHRVTDDWQPMRAQAVSLQEVLQKQKTPEKQELHALVSWLIDDHFTFLGYCEFNQSGRAGKTILTPVKSSLLGILRDADEQQLAAVIPYQNDAYINADWQGSITKSDQQATVHRPSPMDLITVQRYDSKGKCTGRVCFVGLFTSAAYNLSVHQVPMLRTKVSAVIENSGFAPSSHDGKAFANILESFPRDALFQSEQQEILDIATGILHLQDRQHIRLFSRRDQYNRFHSCMVYVPRDRYNRELRLKIQSILLEEFNGYSVEFDTLFSSESILARLYYVIHTNPGQELDVDIAHIEQRIVDASRTWEDNLHDALNNQFGEEHAHAYYNRYEDAFPSSYKDNFSPRTACFDIKHIELARNIKALEMNLYRPLTQDEETVNFKLFSPDTFIAPSHILPVLENMGLTVIGEHPYRIDIAEDDIVWIHEFSLRRRDGQIINLEKVADKFQDAFARVWHGEIENDGFNRLVVDANLHWRDTVMLRAYCKYAMQIRVPFSQDYMIATLAKNTAITQQLVQLFNGRFDPENTLPVTEQEQIRKAIRHDLEAVSNLDEDRILRGFLNIIESTLRTNYFQRDAKGNEKPYLSFKLDPSKIKTIPLPRPMFEIFVVSPRVEGVHLRGGRVARGGLRWSDRREDFRTEVLGLMKAQMVKNSVIVPVGSKGGFVVKRPPEGADRETMMEEVVYCYKTFLSGLLDLTDNLVGGKTVPPQDVVRYDEDDPYLVVAADKGTATFSDIANSVSEEYGFWLGDAFASGGSIGYDHKKMGITARGAWESVKRHFRELGVNTQTEPFTVIGIGDMGGDVFGNGMLLSEQIKLIGAFNHLHIFIDPKPDPAKSFAERQRLFNLPRSSWEDYDKKLISKGGGIFNRSAKSIKLTAEMKALLGVKVAEMAPNELINCLLKAEVDLLWNGGIGTYVKAKDETHADVRDRANDPVRVNGEDLRCKVVGEGGNLGLTQRGRIEYAKKGGLLYTDAIDNSAGVDCSDHEVNIKILVNSAVDAGDMTTKQRNALLAKMTDEVGELVLEDNYAQTQAISVENNRAARQLEEHARFINKLESQGKLDRAIEYLPDPETVAERLSAGQGLYRPELAVIVSYSKMTMYDEVVASSLPEDSYFNTRLVDYFPQPLRKKFADQIGHHRLRREIIATVVTNELVNRVGPTFAHRIHDQLGAHPADVCSAFVAGSVIFDMHSLWRDIEALDNQVPATTQMELLRLVRGLSERCIHWLIRNHRTEMGIEAIIDYFKDDVAKLAKSMPKPLAEINNKTHQSRISYFTKAGVPEDLATRVSMVVPYSSALDIVDIAKVENEKVTAVAEVFFTLGQVLELQWLRDEIADLSVSNHWHLLAKSGLRTDLHARQSSLAADILHTTNSNLKPQDRVEEWQMENGDAIEKYTRLVAEMKATRAVDFAMLSLAVNEVHNLQLS